MRTNLLPQKKPTEPAPHPARYLGRKIALKQASAASKSGRSEARVGFSADSIRPVTIQATVKAITSAGVYQAVDKGFVTFSFRLSELSDSERSINNASFPINSEVSITFRNGQIKSVSPI